MDKMKRIFSFVLVFAILAGSFASFSTVAYADTAVATEGTEVLKKVPADVIGTEHEDAVRRLVAFGIIGGYPDGSYKPERVVNRAQFAKIIVEALGLRDAVPAAEGQSTGFKDVAGDYWAAGYINVASGQGLIKGYPDGTFKPAREVTYAQALTMLVRALGYQDEFLRGTWPGNYVSKAADVGITSGVRIPSNAQEAAKRGYVAELVNNALDAKVVKVDTYKPNTGSVEYYETEIPLLKDKLEISKYEDTRIVADKIVDDGLDKDEVTVRFLEDTDRHRNDSRYSRGQVVKKDFDKGAEETFRFYADVNPREIIGEEVTTYVDDHDKVIYVEDERDDKANFDFVQALDGEKLDLVNFDKEYDFETRKDAGAVVWVYDETKDRFQDFRDKEIEDIKKKDLVGRMGKVVVKNNRIVYAEFQQASDVNDEWLLVRENNDGNLMGVSDQTEDFKLDLRKDKDYDYALVYNTKGEKMSLKDIKKGNIVYVDEIDYDGDDVALVTVVADNKIEGEVGRVKEDRIEIDKKEIKVVHTKDGDKIYHASYTNDDYDEVFKWEPSKGSDWEDDMEDAYKEKAVAYKDGAGRIAFLEVGGGNSGYRFGIVTRTYADGDRIRIFTTIDGKSGNDQIFRAEKERDISDDNMISAMDEKAKIENQPLLGSAVKFRLNSDGEIADGKFFVMPEDQILTMEDDFGKDVIRTKERGSLVVPSDSVIVIDAETAPVKPSTLGEKVSNLDGVETSYKYDKDEEKWDVDVDDFTVSTWKDMKEDKKDDRVRFYAFPKSADKKGEVDGLVFVGKDGASTGSDEIAVYVLDQWKTGDKLKVEYVSFENNEKQTREVSREDKLAIADSDVKKERAYAAKEKSNGKIDLLGELGKSYEEFKDYEVYRGVEIEKVRGNYIVLKNKVEGKDEFYASGALIYDEDKTKSISYLSGKKVDIVADGIRARVIGVVGSGETVKPGTPSVKGQYEVVAVTVGKDGVKTVVLKDSKDKTTTIRLAESAPVVKKGDKIKDLEIVKIDGEDTVIDFKKVEDNKEDNKELEEAEKAVTEAKAELGKAKEAKVDEKLTEEVTKAKAELEKAKQAVTDAGDEATEEAKQAVTDAEAKLAKAEQAVTDAESKLAKAVEEAEAKLAKAEEALAKLKK